MARIGLNEYTKLCLTIDVNEPLPRRLFNQKDGIRPNCLLAVLLQRETDADFLGDICLNVDAGMWQNGTKFRTG